MPKKLIYVFFALFFYQFSFATTSSPVAAIGAMVVSSSPLASEVGLQVLKQGGNAIDAATAIGYALAVVDPCCGNIGGGGFMLIHFKNGKNTFINFRERAPLAIKPEMFLKNNQPDTDLSQQGYLAVGVPGTVKGLNYALQKYGSMPLHQVMQPAIELAEKGFTMPESLSQQISRQRDKFLQEKNIAAIFLKDDAAYPANSLFKQLDLASSLKAIADDGDKAFYQGKISAEIVKASQAQGGVLSEKDFRQYYVTESKPVICHYRGFEIITSPPPSSGGVVLCEMLKILEAYPLTNYGYNAFKTKFLMIEAMRYAYEDRNRYLGDPAFMQNPINYLLSAEHIKSIQKKINFQQQKLSNVSKQKMEPMQTTNYAVVDKDGNAVVVTYTLNGFFGAKVIAGNTGFFLNNEIDDFSLAPGTANFYGLVQGKSNLVEGGKRPLSSMAPTIVLKDEKTKLLIGAAGGSTITTQILLAITNVIDFHMNIAEAINSPRFHFQGSPNIVYMEPNAFSAEVEKELIDKGYRLKTGFISKNRNTWGESTGIERDFIDQQWLGSADERYHGAALGY